MDEMRRMAYLDALGIDSYISRVQQPGAAATRRLAIVPVPSREAPGSLSDSSGVRQAVAPARRENLRSRPLARIEQTEDSTALAADSLPRGEAAPQFSLTAIVAGDWLWLEELVDMALTTEQVQLVQSMAQALLSMRGSQEKVVMSASRPDVAQFDWPIHTNHQLDLSAEAAQASVAGFVGRRLEQQGCRGVVLLGQSCALRVPVQQISVPCASTASSREILARPALKRQVWRDLQLLVAKP